MKLDVTEHLQYDKFWRVNPSFHSHWRREHEHKIRAITKDDIDEIENDNALFVRLFVAHLAYYKAHTGYAKIDTLCQSMLIRKTGLKCNQHSALCLTDLK